MSDGDDIFNSNNKNKFVRLGVFLYKIFDVPVTAVKGSLKLKIFV